MKIVVTEGCTCFGCDIDGIDANDVEESKLRQICKDLIDRLNKNDLVDIIWRITENKGKMKYCYTCDDCGDSVCEFKLKI